MNFDTEKLYQQASAKAAAAKRHTTVKIGGRAYSLQFDTTHWHYVVTDDAGEWMLNINTKSIAEAKRFLANWLAN